ncbi:MAG: ferritin-like domain-containing protein [Myxococcota bacterium]|nr:ferritin-like domain-containing protein [Myxococcota bacterium]MDW8360770.1 ferritin-like domain-containing protein [Myxococcales bacterium]
MTLRFVDQPPREVIEGLVPVSDPARDVVERIAEIFRTPLTGAYAWSYEDADRKIRRLYELGKQLGWNAALDLDWASSWPRTQAPIAEVFNPFVGYEPFERMSEEEKLAFAWHQHAWTLSQFLHGEQGALLVASQLVSCAPTHEAKLYAASQTFDEARHVEAFGRYLREKVGILYPVNPHLKVLLDKILTDPRWDLKFIGMQIIIEGLALSAFQTLRMVTLDPLLHRIIELVTRDESRHVAFGVTYMESFVRGLPRDEVEARARFAYEACVVMRERLVATEVLERFGWNVEEGRRILLESHVMEEFRRMLFQRIVPNLSRIGLLTDSVRPLYDALGILQFENLVDDGVIDWARLEAPLQRPAA